MSIVNKYINCENAGISSESLFRLLLFTDIDNDVKIRIYNNGISNDSLESLNCNDKNSIKDIFRNMIVYDADNNFALNIC